MLPTDRELLKQALEALEDRCGTHADERRVLIPALRERLAQPAQQEPVALEQYDAGLLNDFGGGNVEWWWDYIRAELGRAYEHYQSQIAAQPDHIVDANKMVEQPAQQQEPVAWGNLANWCLDSDRVLITDKDEAAKYHRDVYDLTPLYTAPQPRKPLTDEQIDAVIDAPADIRAYIADGRGKLRLFARAVEAAHGIKGENT